MWYNRQMFASLCLLAYKRPQLLHACVQSLLQTIDYPCEIIINYDGLDNVADFAPEGFVKASKQILVYGKNRGVGRSFQNCLGLSEGDYIFKLDTDLIFQPKWLSTAVKILETNPEVASVGLFDYNKWDPNDPRFKPEENVIQTMKTWDFEYSIVKDFVSSAYGFRAGDKTKFEGLDDGFHQKLKDYGKLALKDMVINESFGPIKSTYISGTEDHPYKTPVFDEPLLFHKTAHTP